MTLAQYAVAGNYLIDRRTALECDQGPTLAIQDRAIRNLRFWMRLVYRRS
jgi:hypothetical protein